MRRLLLRFHLLGFDMAADFAAAASSYRRCRRAGTTPRGSSTAITGLSQMFSSFGVIVSVSIVTAILNRVHDPGLTQSHLLFVVAGVLLFVMVPLLRRVPNHKGRW